MGFLGKLDRATLLFGGMADRLGVDPTAGIGSEAVASGYRGALLRCASCPETGACAGWQASHSRAEAAPDYCRNRHLLAGMPQTMNT